MGKHAQLAIHGGEPSIRSPLPRYNSLGPRELDFVCNAMQRGPLSGYLGGIDKGGYWCEELSEQFKKRFGVRHAIVVNSATSGILAACVAAGIGRDTIVGCSPYTMSASLAPAVFLGSDFRFFDIEPDTCNMAFDPSEMHPGLDALIVPNIFGHPAQLANFRAMCDARKIVMIEDNAQSPFAKEYGRYAGTIGHIGVFSLNVHKHIQCGEGGVVVTDDDAYADKIRRFCNHSELSGGSSGLNLRMTELQAAVACGQMDRADTLVQWRVDYAEQLIEYLSPYVSMVIQPVVRQGCRHVYYTLVIQTHYRDWFTSALRGEGFPIQNGYSILPTLPAFHTSDWDRGLPVTRAVDNSLSLIEICAHDPSKHQMLQIKDAIDKVCEALGNKLSCME